MKNYQNRLDKLEEKIILSQRAEINDDEFDKLLCVIADEDLRVLCNCSGDVQLRNVQEMLLKYKVAIGSYQMSRVEKLKKVFFRDEIDRLSTDQQNEVKKKTEKGREIISCIVDHWEEKLAILKVS